MMRWIKRVFDPFIVVVSEPYLDGLDWSYLFGDEKKFELRKFRTADDAYNSYKITLTGLSLGSPVVSIKIIKLDVDQARAIRGEVSYRALIESRIKFEKKSEHLSEG